MPSIFDKTDLCIGEFLSDKRNIEFPVYGRLLSARNDFELCVEAWQMLAFFVPGVQCTNPVHVNVSNLHRIGFYEFEILLVGRFFAGQSRNGLYKASENFGANP